jgi:hypothetical protein
MARATKALITRQDLINMADDGLVLLRPGSGIESSGNYINKVLSREEIANFAYIYGGNYDLGGGVFTSSVVFTGPETTAPTPGFAYDLATVSIFKPDPSVDGKNPNSGSITNVYTGIPQDKNRMTHYGTDARFSDTIVSPTVGVYSKTIALVNNQETNGSLIATINVGKNGTTPTSTYTRTSTGSTDLSGNIRLGNLVNFSLTLPSVWPTGGILTMEILENGVISYTKSVSIAANGSSSLTINDYKIQYGVNYQFKGKSFMVTEFDGAYSNVTGQRACALV